MRFKKIQNNFDSQPEVQSLSRPFESIQDFELCMKLFGPIQLAESQDEKPAEFSLSLMRPERGLFKNYLIAGNQGVLELKFAVRQTHIKNKKVRLSVDAGISSPILAATSIRN